MVSTLNIVERDLLQAVLQVARDEFRDEPDLLRRLLSRIERLPTAGETADLAGARTTGASSGIGPVLLARQP
jgi:hypothetical protein